MTFQKSSNSTILPSFDFMIFRCCMKWVSMDEYNQSDLKICDDFQPHPQTPIKTSAALKTSARSKPYGYVIAMNQGAQMSKTRTYPKLQPCEKTECLENKKLCVHQPIIQEVNKEEYFKAPYRNFGSVASCNSGVSK